MGSDEINLEKLQKYFIIKRWRIFILFASAPRGLVPKYKIVFLKVKKKRSNLKKMQLQV